MKKTVFSTILVASFFLAGFVAASEGDNLSNYAWSENIGWISFNCTNGGGCAVSDYGVNIDPNSGEFSGEAWSENIGWISFNKTETGAPPAAPYQEAELDYIAKIDLASGEVTGWARALSFGGGWDGWIKLRGDSYGVTADTGTGAFSGWAWSDMVIGWISMSGSNYGVVVDPSVFNDPPDRPTKVGAGETWNHCSIQGKSVPVFAWNYSDPDGDPQASYEIEVDNNASFAAPKFNHLVNSPSTSYALDLSHDDDSDWISELAWNTTYFWRVRVKDSYGNWSVWMTPDELKTPFHAYPWPDFEWFPQEPNQGEAVLFDPDSSQAYGETEISSYLWTITEGAGEFVEGTDSFSRYPYISFSTADNQIRLRVTDSGGYSCQSSAKEITAQLPLPEYQEVPPTGWIQKILAAISEFFKSLLST
jgi:hypothetical protein